MNENVNVNGVINSTQFVVEMICNVDTMKFVIVVRHPNGQPVRLLDSTDDLKVFADSLVDYGLTAGSSDVSKSDDE